MTKQALRKQFLADRMCLSTHAIATQNEAIAGQFLSILPIVLSNIDSPVLHTFLPIKTKNEVDTFLIINQLQQNFTNIRIIVPQVVTNSLVLSHVCVDSKTQFRDDKWGIPVPNVSTPYQEPKSKITAVLVPLLAYDLLGYRVGYGKGFYDRFLAECNPEVIKIGLSFFDPVQAISDTNPYDIPLNYCITPRQVWQF
jgi:5-formyltetrahydrofolate cyclo-ligase